MEVPKSLPRFSYSKYRVLPRNEAALSYLSLQHPLVHLSLLLMALTFYPDTLGSSDRVFFAGLQFLTVKESTVKKEVASLLPIGSGVSVTHIILLQKQKVTQFLPSLNAHFLLKQPKTHILFHFCFIKHIPILSGTNP